MSNEQRVRWITPQLGTAAWSATEVSQDYQRVDVRNLVDRDGNETDMVRLKIEETLGHLRAGETVVVCCDYGMSRSNSIAAGALSQLSQRPLEDAVAQVLAATGENAIQLSVLSSVRRALDQDVRPSKNTASTSRRVLVTGSGGFVGRSLCPLLKKSHEVEVLKREEVDLQCDAVPLDLLVKRARIDTVVHLANPRIYTTNEAFGLALTMLKNTIDVCVENDLRLIFPSSWEIYAGYHAQEMLADENTVARPGGTYGLSKQLSEEMIAYYRRERGLRALILRSSPVYGLNSDKPRFIWNFLDKALNNQEIVTHRFQNGLPALDLLHIDDLCLAIQMAVSHAQDGDFNIGTGCTISTAQVARLVVEKLESQSVIAQQPITRLAANIAMDTRKAQNLWGWQAQTAFQDGLDEIVNSLRTASA